MEITENMKKFSDVHLMDYITKITTEDKRGGKNMFRCPFCGSGDQPGPGHNGAFSYKPATAEGHALWRCFACGKGGDLYDLIQQDKTLTHDQAITYAYQFYREPVPAPGTNSQAKGTGNKNMSEEKVNPEEKRKAIAFIKEAHKNIYGQDLTGLRYMRERGFDNETIKKYHIGYATGYNYDNRKAPRIVIPYPGKTYFLTRLVNDEAPTHEPKFKKSTSLGSEPLFEIKKQTPGDVTFIVESQIDALIIAQEARSMELKHINAIALGGKNATSKLNGHENSGAYIVALDNDAGEKAKATEEASRKLYDSLKEKNKLVLMAKWNTRAYAHDKDPNEMLLSNKNAFRDDLRRNYENGYNLLYESVTACRSEIYLQKMLSNIQSGNVRAAISTGFDSLDEAIGGGLYPGLYFMGAISSMGKTTLLLQIADQLAKQGFSVLYYSLEMGAEELIGKSISRYTHTLNPFKAFSLFEILHSNFNRKSDLERQALAQAIELYKNEVAHHLQIIEGVGNIKVSDIRSQAMKLKEVTGVSPIIFIDYLQILAPEEDDKRATDKQVTDKAVVELKRLSRDLDTPIMAISSINRSSYAEPVTLSSFKESGAIEYGSDVLLGLQPYGMVPYPGKKDDLKRKNIEAIDRCKKEKKERRLVVTVLKNRNGIVGNEARFICYPRYNRFNDKIIEPWPTLEEPASKKDVRQL